MKVRAAKGGRRNIIEVTSGRAEWSLYELAEGLGEEAGVRSPMCFNGTNVTGNDEIRAVSEGPL